MTRKVVVEIKELQSTIRENPSRAQVLVNFVNTLSKEALLERRIMNRIDAVIIAQGWLTKNHLTISSQPKNA